MNDGIWWLIINVVFSHFQSIPKKKLPGIWRWLRKPSRLWRTLQSKQLLLVCWHWKKTTNLSIGGCHSCIWTFGFNILYYNQAMFFPQYSHWIPKTRFEISFILRNSRYGQMLMKWEVPVCRFLKIVNSKSLFFYSPLDLVAKKNSWCSWMSLWRENGEAWKTSWDKSR